MALRSPLLFALALLAPACQAPVPTAGDEVARPVRATVMLEQTPTAAVGTHAGPQEAPVREAEVPLRRSQLGHILVPVQLGQRDYLFVFDTGANVTTLSEETAAAMHLDLQAGRRVEVGGANGSVKAVPELPLPSIRLGGHERSQMPVMVMDLRHMAGAGEEPIAGVLGLDFFRDTRVALDLRAQRLRVYAAQSPAPSIPGGRVVPLNRFPRTGLLRVEAKIDALALPTFFDSGSPASLINWKAAEALGLSRDDPSLYPATRPLVGADKRAMGLVAHRFARIEVGGTVFEDVEVHIADLEVFEALGVGSQPAFMMGAQMLEQRRVVVDYVDQNLSFGPPPELLSSYSAGTFL